jgi:hypothetical protein
VKKRGIYEVTLRRDVQQMACVRLHATSRQEAIRIAESAVDANAWSVEENVGNHKPHVRKVKAAC